MCFRSPSPPAAPAPPPPPPAPVKFAEKRVQSAGARARTRTSQGGRQATVLTGPLGLPGAASTGQRTLLGG